MSEYEPVESPDCTSGYLQERTIPCLRTILLTNNGQLARVSLDTAHYLFRPGNNLCNDCGYVGHCKERAAGRKQDGEKEKT